MTSHVPFKAYDSKPKEPMQKMPRRYPLNLFWSRMTACVVLLDMQIHIHLQSNYKAAFLKIHMPALLPIWMVTLPWFALKMRAMATRYENSLFIAESFVSFNSVRLYCLTFFKNIDMVIWQPFFARLQ